MSYYGNLEDGKKEVQNRIDILRFTASQIDKIKPVFRAFDGKIYNKRFDDAIEALSDDQGRFYVSNHYRWMNIEAYKKHSLCNERYSALTVPSCSGERFEDFAGREDSIFTENKRIIADKAIKALDTRKEKLLEQAASYEKTLEDADDILAQVAYFKGILGSLIETVPYELRQYLKISDRI